ncbi:MAG: hypothetical protein ACJAU4_001100 [Glaciecola sp.]|jgi:hypothetical protein
MGVLQTIRPTFDAPHYSITLYKENIVHHYKLSGVQILQKTS